MQIDMVGANKSSLGQRWTNTLWLRPLWAESWVTGLVNPFLAMESSSHRTNRIIWRELWLPPTRKLQRSCSNQKRHESIPKRQLCIGRLGCQQGEGCSFLDNGMPECGGQEGWGGKGDVNKTETHLCSQQHLWPTYRDSLCKNSEGVWVSSFSFLFSSVSGMWWGFKKEGHLDVYSSQKTELKS